MNIEQKINDVLRKTPIIKKVIKRIYQIFNYILSPKIKCEGNVIKMSPDDGYEYFFGYYDKSPWDMTESYMLSLRVKDSTESMAPKEPAEIVLIDIKTKNIRIIGVTHTWNIQQGAMLQWLGPDFISKVIYNDFREGKYVSVIYNLHDNTETVIDFPVYNVSNNGRYAVSLDFSRLHRLREGYGYSNISDSTSNDKCPDTPAVWKIDLLENSVTSLLSYKDLYNFEQREEMKDAEHKVNHLMINPSGERFMLLHRWIKGNTRYTRLVTADLDGGNLFNLSDDDMVSHCNWKNDKEIIGYANKKNFGNGYFLMEDGSRKFKHLWEKLAVDGHPSYSPDKKLVATDSYPDKARIQNLYILKENENEINIEARVFSPFKYDNNTRCDLHPKWDRKGEKVSIDAVFEGKRALYIVDLKK